MTDGRSNRSDAESAAERSAGESREGASGETGGNEGSGDSGGRERQGSTPDPEEMSLDELRQEISDIDQEIVELIARRTYVADTIAGVKSQRDLPTVDEDQEERVMDRAGRNAERFDVDANLVKAIFRLLIELNKVHQREKR